MSLANSSSLTQRSKREAFVSADLKNSKFYGQITSFLEDSKAQLLPFPSSLSAEERREIHELCEDLGLFSRSEGQAENRRIVVSKNAREQKLPYSLAVRKRFVKDYSLPIPLIVSPYYEYYLDLFDPLLKTRQKEAILKQSIESLGSERSFLDNCSILKDSIIKSIKSSPDYKKFDSMPLPPPPSNFPRPPASNVFTSKNAGKMFVSLDLRCANFAVLRRYAPEVVGDSHSYDEFIRKYSSDPYLRKSKHFRQFVFGNLNPQHLTAIWKRDLLRIYQALLENGKFCVDDFEAMENDELVVKVPDPSKMKEIVERLESLLEPMGFTEEDVRLEGFKVVQLGCKEYFVKEVVDTETNKIKSVDFKRCPLALFPQCYRYYRGEEITEWDRKFVFEGLIATFDTPIDFGMTEEHKNPIDSKKKKWNTCVE